MAANKRAKSAGYSLGEQMSYTQANTIDTNAAGAVNRASTLGGVRAMPLVQRGVYGVKSVIVATAGVPYIVTTTSTNEELYTFELMDLPHGHTFNHAYLMIYPKGAHGGQPGILPKVRVYKTNYGGTASVIGSASISWTSTAAYQAKQTLTVNIATASQTIDRTKIYAIQFRNEGGANAAGNVELQQLAVSVVVNTASGGADFSFWP